jgi:hypothetical protein
MLTKHIFTRLGLFGTGVKGSKLHQDGKPGSINIQRLSLKACHDVHVRLEGDVTVSIDLVSETNYLSLGEVVHAGVIRVVHVVLDG